jgi:hypothetical protein
MLLLIIVLILLFGGGAAFIPTITKTTGRAMDTVLVGLVSSC